MRTWEVTEERRTKEMASLRAKKVAIFRVKDVASLEEVAVSGEE